jgi:uncharacterized protein YehS (DUF1456 family)
MQTNDVLRRLRYALDSTEHQMAKLMNHRGEPVAARHVTNLLRAETHEEMVLCTPLELERYLDGLIIDRRGPPDPTRPPPPSLGNAMTNNDILKKLRIALKFTDVDMLRVLREGGLPMGKAELSALFRKRNHKHYRECGDQLLRNFLRGLAMELRG